jgi:hypothetical protein
VVESGSGQNRSALAAVRALSAAGYRPAVTVSTASALAAVSRHCRRVVRTPPVGTAGFTAAVGAELRAFPYLGAMPSSDAAILALSAPGAQLVDKQVLARRAAQVGLRTPQEWVFDTSEDLLAAAHDLTYPVVVKASRKTGPEYRPAERITSPDGLLAFISAPGPHTVQPYIPDEVHSLNGLLWQGRLVVTVHQRHVGLWPPVCGDACLAVTTEPPEPLSAQVVQLLEGYEGIFQVEMAGDYVLDVNPRVYGSVALAVQAGANLVGLYWNRVRGLPVTPPAPRIGVTYCWWEGEARRMLARLRGGDTNALRTLPVLAGQFLARELCDDPTPVLSRLRFAVTSGAERRSNGRILANDAQDRAGDDDDERRPVPEAATDVHQCAVVRGVDEQRQQRAHGARSEGG